MSWLKKKNKIVRFQKLNFKATVPLRGSSSAAGYDLNACFENRVLVIEIDSEEVKLIGTGIAIEIPEGYFGAIFARSGLATKEGLRPANCVGVIDSDYRGEVKIPLYNDSRSTKRIYHGDRIAQLVIMPYLAVDLEEVLNLDSTERGKGGFGSTGK